MRGCDTTGQCQKDIDDLEGVQSRGTKVVKGGRELEERLKIRRDKRVVS